MLYDTVYSSYDFGPGLWNKTFYAHIDDTCSNWWINPKGQLFRLSWNDTYDFMEAEDGKFTTVPNGRRGRVCASEFSGKVELWIAEWKSWYAPTPAINVFFDLGEVGYSMRKPKYFFTCVKNGPRVTRLVKYK